MAVSIPVPVCIRFLADEVGEELAFCFIEACGGQKIWVPGRRIAASRLAQTWGIELARCLARQYGGDHYQVPLLKEWRIRRLAMLGLPYNAIVCRVGVGRSQVTNVLRGISHDVQQVRHCRVQADRSGGQLTLF